jgi:BASS family bile acid:Na+ symporter
MTALATTTVFFMMLALGMTLRLGDFRRVATSPRAVCAGLVGQVVLLPLAAFAVAHAFALPARFAVGMMLVAACPGGATSNLFSFLARGDIALSITLTACSSMVSFVTVPFVVTLALRAFGTQGPPIQLSITEMVIALFGATALPVLLGIATLHRAPALAARLHRPLLAVSGTVLVLLIIGLFVGTASSGRDMVGLAAQALPAVVLLIAATAVIGAGSAVALGLGSRVARTLAIEIGIQNVNVAFFVAISILDEPVYAGVAVLYLPMQLVFAGAVIGIGRRSVEANLLNDSSRAV